MSKFDSKVKVITLTALVASTAIVTYASQEKLKTTEENVDTPKLVIDKVDKDTVKVSVDNVNNSAKAFQLSLKVDGNATFNEKNIKWLTNTQKDEEGNSVIVDDRVTNDTNISSDGKSLDIFVTGDKELTRNGSTLEVCELDLNKVNSFKNSTYKVIPNTKDGKATYKSVDANNKSVEVASMDYDAEQTLSFNTPPTITLKESIQELGKSFYPNIDKTNKIITIKENYDFKAKDFVDIADEEDTNISKDSIVVTDADGNVIPDSKSDFKTGSYKINYTATDSSNESTILSIDLRVEPEVWNTPPTITGVPTEAKSIYTGGIFDVNKPDGTNSVTAKDAGNNNIEVKISGDFNPDVAGEYAITYSAKDRFDNTTSKDLTLNVIQNDMPIISGVEDKIINRGESFNSLDNVSATDDGQNVAIENIKVTGSVNTNIAKKYTLNYEVADDKDSSKKTIVQRNITVNGAPSIYGDLSDMIVRNGQAISDEDILSGINAEDDLDETIALELNKNGLDTSKDGEYTVEISATDSKGLKSIANKKIVVTSKDIIELPESGDGSSEEHSKQFRVIDKSVISTINSTLSNLTKDNEVKITKTTLGDNVIYNINVVPNKIAFRQNTNEHFINITVPKSIDEETGGIVITQYETIKVSSIVVNGNEGEMKIGQERVLNTIIAPENADNKDLLWTSTNNDVVSITPSQNTQSATIKALKKGTSTIRVMATDGSGKYQELVVQVGEQPKEDTEAPVFDYKGKTDITLANGMKFETPVVTASDNVDTGITVNTSILDSKGLNVDKIDTTIPGEYKITYTAKDKSNNKAELVIKVTVKEAITGVEVGSGNAASEEKALEVNIPTQVSGLNTLLDEIKNDKYEPKVYGKPVIDEAKNEATYIIKLYKKQSFFAKLFNTNKNEEVYYLKLTVKNTDEFKNVLNKLPVENKDEPTLPPTGGGGGGNPVLPPTIEFSDIAGHFAEKEIKEFVKLGHIEGYGDDTFRPNNPITRAEFVKIVNKVFELTDKGTQNFKDISNDKWYYEDICIAVKAGYINGYEDNTFRPNEDITRQEAAKIVASLVELKHDGVLNFKDKDTIAPWAKDFVDELTDNNIIKGYEDNTFRPTKNISRAETVLILSRVSK